MDIQLGFSTGCFHETSLSLAEKIAAIRNAGCHVIELGAVKLPSFDSIKLKQLTSDNLAEFDYISLHAPKFGYGHNDGTYKIFEKIKQVNAIRTLDWVVVHPDEVIDFSVFKEVGFKVAFENMDNRKKSHKTPDELVKLFAENPQFGFVLDVTHSFSNDPTMQLVADFYKKLGGRIVEIHLSGYSGYHEPISETKQPEIIKAIQNFDVPIIVESVISPQDIKKEKDYILQTINKL